jgi:hypothetical protein
MRAKSREEERRQYMQNKLIVERGAWKRVNDQQENIYHKTVYDRTAGKTFAYGFFGTARTTY